MTNKCPLCENKEQHTSIEEAYYYHPELMKAVMDAFNRIQEKRSREWVKSKIYK